MHLPTIAVGTLAALTGAHATGLSQIIAPDSADVKVRSLLRNIGARLASPLECGEGIGSCPAGKCCSSIGCKSRGLGGIRL
jgi:hypothetical protein